MAAPRLRSTTGCLCILLTLWLTGCTDAPGENSAKAVVPVVDDLGEPAEWARAQGLGRYEPVGALELFLVFSAEVIDPVTSALLSGSHNYKDLVRPDPTVGDGRARHWLFQYVDEEDVAIQQVQDSRGTDFRSAWGPAWDWSFWALAAPGRPIPDMVWELTAEEALGSADDAWLDRRESGGYDHVQMLYLPEGEDGPHWLFAQWTPEGNERHHLMVDATTGEVVPMEDLYPAPASVRSESDHRLHVVPTVAPRTVTIPVSLDGASPAFEVQVVSAEGADPEALVIDVTAPGWRENGTWIEGNGSWSARFERAPEAGIGANVTVRLRDGPWVDHRFTFRSCLEAPADPLFGRAADPCSLTPG